MTWAQWLAAASAICCVSGTLTMLFRHIFVRPVHEVKADVEVVKDSVKAIDRKFEDFRLDMAVQFGGNGGGMRQAVDALSKDLSHLCGQFEQHIRESGT